MAVADRRCSRHELVHNQLQKSYNRIPAKLRRYIRAARRQHPVRRTIKAAVLEEGHRVARILEIDEPNRSPSSIWSGARAGGRSVLVHKAHERSIAKPGKPGGRYWIASVSEEAPKPA